MWFCCPYIVCFIYHYNVYEKHHISFNTECYLLEWGPSYFKNKSSALGFIMDNGTRTSNEINNSLQDENISLQNYSVQKLSLSLVLKTNKAMKKHDTVHEFELLSDKQPGHSGHQRFVRPSLGSPWSITCHPCYWFNPASRCQTLVAHEPEGKGQGWRLMTSSGSFTIAWSVTTWVTDRWLKLMLRLARREIMSDNISTVLRRKKIKGDLSCK